MTFGNSYQLINLKTIMKMLIEKNCYNIIN